MNPTQPGNDDLEARLRGALHSGLDRVHSSVELTDPAIGSARNIRRRRRTAATVAGALAVVAVAAPIAWSTIGNGRTVAPATSGTVLTTTLPSTGATTTAPEPSATTPAAPPSSSAPDPAPTWQNSTTASKVVDLRKVTASGSSVDVIWGDGATLHRDGKSVQQQVQGFWDYTALEGGRGILVDPFDRNDLPERIRVVDAQGKELKEIATLADGETFGVVADPAGKRAVVYIHRWGDKGANARMILVDSQGKTLLEKTNMVHGLAMVGFVGDRFFIGNYDTERSYSWDFATNVVDRYTDTGIVTAVHDATQRATFLTYTDEERRKGCVDIMDVSGARGEVQARTCGVLRPTAFSPDGRYVLAVDVNGDGFGPTFLNVLDTQTGTSVLKLEGGAFFDETFLADGSLAVRAVVMDDDKLWETVIRCTISGSCTRLAEPSTMGGGESGLRYRVFDALTD